ncbi:MAG TPA: APC family permease [Anaerolineaceae bacterium]|nr:APC family permease [Anaerolineaceae bacterium]HPN52244.1 APC family permease [Anaerolineaceae bacterium]
MNIEENENATILTHKPAYKQHKTWRTWLIGKPLSTGDAPHQTIGKLVGLAVFASDALSSSAYSPQEVLLVLAAAGTGAFSFSIPITLATISLLFILTFSYQQTIHAYPGGGGAYIVSRDNLGEAYAQVAGAALLTDYILTVAVSTSSGVAQIASAWPVLAPHKVEIAVIMVLLIMLINLRGVKESGFAFAIPTYFFFVMMVITICAGMFKYFTGTLGMVENPPMDLLKEVSEPISLFLILHAFASGTTALTGVEAISNGITAFKEPRSKNAGITLVWMSVILGAFLIGITWLAHTVGAMPSEHETLFSQIARTTFESRGILYLMMISATTVILIMAANTAFADFPRLGALAANDGYLPRQLTFRGDRLVYSWGIVALAVIASLLIIIFQANVTNLLPLYAIGVFLSFTLSQAGMARRWWKCGHLKPGVEKVEPGSVLRFDKNWMVKMVINGFGAVCTLVVMFIFGITKFRDGAWLIILIIPTLVAIFFAIHRHYKGLAKELSLEKHFMEPTQIQRHRVIIPISGVHRGTLAALRYAKTLSNDITAVHVSIDPIEAQKVKTKWETWGEGIRLVVVESEYRLLMEPLLDYIEQVRELCKENEILTVVVPQFIAGKWWSNFLHMNTADQLRKVMLNDKDLVIVEVPYQVK